MELQSLNYEFVCEFYQFEIFVSNALQFHSIQLTANLTALQQLALSGMPFFGFGRKGTSA
jgi:hypothetical protein